jgi:hypothetical protein
MLNIWKQRLRKNKGTFWGCRAGNVNYRDKHHSIHHSHPEHPRTTNLNTSRAATTKLQGFFSRIHLSLVNFVSYSFRMIKLNSMSVLSLSAVWDWWVKNHCRNPIHSNTGNLFLDLGLILIQHSHVSHILPSPHAVKLKITWFVS